ncbi:hypothetical protein D3C75_473770 [compost metagenome]
MITLKDVAKAINQKLNDTFPNVEIQSKNIEEGYEPPCFYVDFDNVNTSKYGPNGFDRTISVIIYYFPASKDNKKLELLDVQQKLETNFVDNLQIVEGFVVYPSDLNTVKVDGVLQTSFDIQLIEIAEDTDGDSMESLNLNL